MMLNINNKPNLIIGEGKDECNFFSALIDHLDLSNVEVQEYKGKSMLEKYLTGLKLEIDRGKYDSILITRDADDNFKGVVQSIKEMLRRIHFPVPNDPGNFVGEMPRIAFYILPDNQNNGCLETLCLQSIEDDPIRNCVDVFWKCLKEKESPAKSEVKSKVHAFLAGQEDPMVRLGEVAKRGIWNFNHIAFDDINAVIRELAC